MSGRMLREGHSCEPPAAAGSGAIWQCDCGRRWHNVSHAGDWYPISRLTAWWYLKSRP